MKTTAVTTVRDEGPFIVEWIAWHRLIGVSDFLFYSNDCRDGTDRLLDALAREGVVRHAPNPASGDQSLQWAALRAAWQHELRKSSDWMLISDVDEFPVIHAGQHRLSDLIAAIPPETDAVAMPWRLFGSDGVIDLIDSPVTSQFRRSAPADMFNPIAGTFFKSLFRPRSFRRPGIHRPRHKPESSPLWISGSGARLPPVIAQNDQRLSLHGAHEQRSLVELHHYSLRSAEAFLVKSQRGLPNRSDKRIDLRYWILRNFNTVQNDAALGLHDALLAEIARLKALPDVAMLHEQALAWHRQRFSELVRTSGGYELFHDTLLAANSFALPADRARRLLQMYSGIGEG